MRLLDRIKQAFAGFRVVQETDWWVEIITTKPRCTYYFGPFSTHDEAKAAYPGYVEDLDSEGAQGITIVIKRCQPTELTICAEEEMQAD
ncbi:MAG: hypothetical protein CLLPBCKN_004514 [Chroococcidiopsis cubana SAG 39.79]|jgi:hypothetical protein|uniref:DUF1816 domain-containing protein n=2 Tax=Chroococcidiopsis TaxID=54298 RepID=K9TZ14_CHRTP|nr:MULTISPECIES: DUF1816 domain-containing protein [Chroococcidiopsis]PSB40906.1 DUF1816 domain-containing protein [Cyanosarcina cf. burmensis CCALA 770]AFY87406.1 protein of unknown function DUF1816 [Chroococcidiopsis thermalis PCC 7203]MDZ4875118.1 hypothetical protein [Chroococcidiopsis cubana SAG 39.79]PSB61298.1 DUF1816 domain-containing protein [Chroococcidiopsis cubana CCALA 043]RUT09395.1 hypothetical protein DSM107010_45110 [Chroococcidiopsis cubana SAG 39.79]